MKKAVIYLRVSTSPQEEGLSLAIQEEACLALAESLGYEVPQEFIFREVWSGADHHRPALNRLRAVSDAGLVQAVFVYNPTRLGRDPLHISVTYAELRATGLDVQFVHGNIEDTPEGRLVLYVQGFAGQQERAQFAERSMATKRAVAKSGRLPVGTGAGLYGYDYDKQEKKRFVNEAEKVAVLMAFDWRLSHINDYQIAVKLNELGFRTKRGCRWQHRTVSRMLANESYAGVDYYGRFRWRRLEGNKIEVTPQPEDEVIRIDVFTPPIISRSLFERAQKVKHEPRAVVRAEKKSYLLTGFSRCLTCGSAVVGACLNRRWRYYHCRATAATAARPASCQEKYIPADQYEEEAWTLIREVLEDPAVLVAELRSHLEGGVGDTAEEKSKLGREVAELKREETRLLLLRQKDTNGLIDDEVFFGQLAPVRALRDEKQRAVALLEEQERNRDDAALVESRVVEMCGRVSSKLDSLDFQGKRTLMEAFGIKIQVVRDDFRMTMEVSPEVTTIGQTLASPRERSRRSRWA